MELREKVSVIEVVAVGKCFWLPHSWLSFCLVLMLYQVESSSYGKYTIHTTLELSGLYVLAQYS